MLRNRCPGPAPGQVDRGVLVAGEQGIGHGGDGLFTRSRSQVGTNDRRHPFGGFRSPTWSACDAQRIRLRVVAPLRSPARRGLRVPAQRLAADRVGERRPHGRPRRVAACTGRDPQAHRTIRRPGSPGGRQNGRRRATGSKRSRSPTGWASPTTTGSTRPTSPDTRAGVSPLRTVARAGVRDQRSTESRNVRGARPSGPVVMASGPGSAGSGPASMSSRSGRAHARGNISRLGVLGAELRFHEAKTREDLRRCATK